MKLLKLFNKKTIDKLQDKICMDLWNMVDKYLVYTLVKDKDIIWDVIIKEDFNVIVNLTNYTFGFDFDVNLYKNGNVKDLKKTDESYYDFNDFYKYDKTNNIYNETFDVSIYVNKLKVVNKKSNHNFNYINRDFPHLLKYTFLSKRKKYFVLMTYIEFLYYFYYKKITKTCKNEKCFNNYISHLSETDKLCNNCSIRYDISDKLKDNKDNIQNILNHFIKQGYRLDEL